MFVHFNRFNYTFVENITLETVIVTEHYPVGVAIDPVDYHVYWTETFSSSRRIRRCNFDGTNPVVLINEKSPWTISLDLINRFVILILLKQFCTTHTKVDQNGEMTIYKSRYI